jgi:tetratricopeptide (TPR) repeat protein
MNHASRGLGLAALLTLGACASAGGESGDVEAAQAHIAAGRAEAERGRHAEAVELFTKAVAAHPELSDAYYHRGCSYVRMRLGQEMQGDSRAAEDKALKDFDAALRLNPANGKAYFNRAMVLAARANFRAAAEDLLQACQYDARNPEPHLQLGRLYEDKFEDRGIAALEHYEKYADLGGRDSATLDKVRAWRELKKAAAPAPAPSSQPPKADDEKKAAELHDEFKRLFRENKKAEALKIVETLLGQYGQTAYVRERAREFSALLGALKK